MSQVFTVKVLEGMDAKIAKKVTTAQVEDGLLLLSGAFNAPIAKMKTSSITNVDFCDREVSAGFLKGTKTTTVTRVFYTTKAGESRQIVMECQTKSDAIYLYATLLNATKQPEESSEIPQEVTPAQAREERLKQRQQDFADVLKEIPRVEIGLDGEKGTARSVEDFVNGLKIKSITARASYSMLGDYVVVDIETGGLSVRDPILEVSAIRFDAYEPTEIFTTLLDPGRHIDEEASAVNGITDDMVEGKPTIWQIMPSLREFVGSSPIVGHNIAFDLKFLYRYGFDLQPGQKVYDTWKLSRKAFPEDSIKDYKLTTIMEKCDLPFPDAHRSAADCLAAGVLFRALAQHLAES